MVVEEGISQSSQCAAGSSRALPAEPSAAAGHKHGSLSLMNVGGVLYVS